MPECILLLYLQPTDSVFNQNWFSLKNDSRCLGQIRKTDIGFLRSKHSKVIYEPIPNDQYVPCRDQSGWHWCKPMAQDRFCQEVTIVVLLLMAVALANVTGRDERLDVLAYALPIIVLHNVCSMWLIPGWCSISWYTTVEVNQFSDQSNLCRWQ